MYDPPRVAEAARALVRALQDGGFEFTLVRGLAVILRGHDRYTRDVDVLAWDLDERLDELPGVLLKFGFQPVPPDRLKTALSTRILHTVWGEDVPVDIMLGLVPLERDMLDHSDTLSLGDEVSTLVATPEELVIMKLVASRNRDITDVIALKELYPNMDRKRIRTIVTDYAEALVRPDIVENLDRWFA